jgi:hypothetical protein
MKSFASFVIAALTAISPGISHASGQLSFGITAPYTKVGGAAPLWNPSQNHVAVSGNDVYVAYGETTASGDEEVLVGHSADGGLTWDAGTVVAHGPSLVPAGAIAIGPDPLAPGAQIVHVVFGTMTDPYGNGAISYMHLRSGAWSAPVVVNVNPATADSGAVAVDGGGGVYIVWADATGIYTSRSGDGGDGFYVLGENVVQGGSRPSVAADSIGDQFVAWADDAGVWFSSRSYRGFTFGAPVYAGNGQKGGSPVLVALDANRMYIGYDWGMALGEFGIALSTSTDGGATFTTRNVVVGQTGHVGLAVSSTGVISLANDSSGVVVQRSTNGGATWTAPVTVASAGSEYPSLALVSGKLVVAYDKQPGQAVYATKEK